MPVNPAKMQALERLADPFDPKNSGFDQQARELMYGKFQDTGREAGSPGEFLDAYTGAPVRTGINESQKGNFNLDTLKKIFGQVGKDPTSAPTGEKIVRDAGVENDTLASVLGLGMDMSADIGGVAGLARKAAVPFAAGLKKLKPGILDEVDSAEKAVALKGPQREEYLKALDEQYGDRATRSKDMGFGSKQTFYHGTPVNKDVDQLSPLLGEPNTKGPGFDLGSFFSSNPKLASSYAGDTGQVIPVKINRKGTKAVYPEMSEFGYDDIEHARSALKKDKNLTIKDDAGSPTPVGEIGDTVIVGDNSSVRSVNAAYDPRFANSQYLMAGGLGATDASQLNKAKRASELTKEDKLKVLRDLTQGKRPSLPERAQTAMQQAKESPSLESIKKIVADNANYRQFSAGTGASKKTFQAKNAADALMKKRAMEEAGLIDRNSILNDLTD